MFWEWFWDLYHISFGTVQPCPSCQLWPCEDCGYLDKWMPYDSMMYEYECMAPDNDDGLMECDGCHHLICSICKSKEDSDG